MATSEQLLGRWVEVREEGTDATIVLRPFEHPLPPARGRRGIAFKEGGAAEARAPGPTDRGVASAGSWSLDGDTLTVSAPGWSGTYRVEERTKDKLVLRRS